MKRLISVLSISYAALLSISLFKFGGKAILADFVFCVLSAVWLVGIVLKKVRFPARPVVFIAGALILANVLSFLNSVYMRGSILNFAGSIYLILIFVVFSSVISSDAGLFFKIIKTIFFAAVVVSVIGISAVLGYRLLGIMEFSPLLLLSSTRTTVVSFPRLGSTLALPEMFINFSIIGLACTMIIWYMNKDFFKVILSMYLSIFIIIAANMLAYSRSLAGLFLTGAVGSFLVRAKDRFYRFIVPVFCVLAAGFMFMSIATSIWSVYPLTFDLGSGQGNARIEFNRTPDIRAMLKDAALRITASHPIFGIGQGMFPGNFIDYIDKDKYKATLALSSITAERPAIDPHSSYFGTLAETGIIGFGAMAALIVYLIGRSIRSFACSDKTDIAFAHRWLFAAFIGYLLNAIYVDIFTMRFFWLALSLLYYSEGETAHT